MTESVEAIKEICKEQGVTQRKLAQMTGHTDAAICRWFQGGRIPSAKALDGMADALGYKINLVPKKNFEKNEKKV